MADDPYGITEADLQAALLAEAGNRRRQMLLTAFGPLIEAALKDESVIEVMVNPDGKLWIERVGEGRVDMASPMQAAETERIIRLVAAHMRGEVHDEAPIVSALERMLAMRSYMRSKTVDGVVNLGVANRVGLTPHQIDEMYRIMAIANYEDRFVIPTTHREMVEDAYDLRGGCGFTDGNGCSTGTTGGKLFGSRKFVTPAEGWK